MKAFLVSILVAGSVVSAVAPTMAYDRCRTPVTTGCEAPAFPSVTPATVTASVTPTVTVPSIPAPEAAAPEEKTAAAETPDVD